MSSDIGVEGIDHKKEKDELLQIISQIREENASLTAEKEESLARLRR